MIKTGKIAFWVTLIMGTVLLLVYYFTLSQKIGIFAYLGWYIVGLANLVIVFLILIFPIKEWEKRKGRFQTIGLILLSISSLIIYYFSVEWLLFESRYWERFPVWGIVGLSNLVFAILLLIFPYREKIIRKRKFRTIGLILLNIPITIIYFFIALWLSNIIRIKIINETDNQIKDIKLSGCGDYEIDRLKNGKSKTIWINNNSRDCRGDFEVKYLIDSIEYSKVIKHSNASSVRNGDIIKYKIENE